jgi:hypothetical protein
MPSENTIYFYPGRGGHSHDGNNSSFIDTSVYSLFDFSWGEVGDPDRRASQRINYNAFRDFVITTVNGSILEPSGLVLQPGMVNGTAHIISRSIEANTIAANTLTANEISANTITSNELAANFVLVNTIIASSDFNGTFDANTFTLSNTGTDGWAITSAGDAVFTNGLFRGNLFVGANDYWYSNGDFALGGNTGIYRNAGGGITLGANVSILGGVIATSVATPGIDIDANGNLTANTFALYGNGAIVTSSGNFSVSATGVMTATGASIDGTIDASDGSIGAWFIDADGIYNSSAGRYVALYPSVGTVSQNVFEVVYAGYAAEISASLMKVSSGAAFSHMSAGAIQTSGYLAVGGAIAINGTDHHADSVRPLVGASSVGVTGNGWVYFPTNMSHDFFPIALGYANSGGALRCIVDNNTGVYFNLTKTSASDRRLKDNIEPISDLVLNKFYSIKTYEFDWNDKTPQYIKYSGRGVGVIADELKELYPEAVDDTESFEGWVHRYDEHPEGFSIEEMKEFGSDFYEFVPGEGVWQKPRYASVDYTVLIPHLISAIHDLNNRVKELESKV